MKNHEKTWKKVFLKNYTQNVVEKLFPDPFLKEANFDISLDQ